MSLATEVTELYDAMDSLSDDFTEYIAKMCDQAALNWLRVYGIPETPADVYRIFHLLYHGIPANLVKDGKFTPNEDIVASDEVVAERKAKREADSQFSLEDMLRSVQGMNPGDDVTRPGMYL